MATLPTFQGGLAVAPNAFQQVPGQPGKYYSQTGQVISLPQTQQTQQPMLQTQAQPQSTSSFLSDLNNIINGAGSLFSGQSSLSPLLGAGLTTAGALQREPGSVTEARQFLRNQFTSPEGLTGPLNTLIGGLQPIFGAGSSEVKNILDQAQQRIIAGMPSSLSTAMSGPEIGSIRDATINELVLPQQRLMGELGLNLLGMQTNAAQALLGENVDQSLAQALGGLGGRLLAGGTGGAGQGGAGDLLSQVGNLIGTGQAGVDLLKSLGGLMGGAGGSLGKIGSTIGSAAQSLAPVLGPALIAAGGYFGGKVLGGDIDQPGTQFADVAKYGTWLGLSSNESLQGASAGAVTGAAAGFAVGGPIGAVVGAIAGGIGGFQGEREARHERKEGQLQQETAATDEARPQVLQEFANAGAYGQSVVDSMLALNEQLGGRADDRTTRNLTALDSMVMQAAQSNPEIMAILDQARSSEAYEPIYTRYGNIVSSGGAFLASPRFTDKPISELVNFIDSRRGTLTSKDSEIVQIVSGTGGRSSEAGWFFPSADQGSGIASQMQGAIDILNRLLAAAGVR